MEALNRLHSFKEITEELRLSNERFEKIFESSPVGMVAVGEEGKIVLVNSEMERLFGYRREEMVGRTIEMLIPQDLRPAHVGFRKKFAAETDSRKMGEGRDLAALRKDGTRIFVEVALNPVRVSTGRWVIAAIADQTALRSHQRALLDRTEQLERSNADLEQFAYVASHDLQEPIRMVASYAELLAERYEKAMDEKGKKYIHYIREGAQRMSALVNSLLRYSRIEQTLEQPTAVSGKVGLQEALQNLEFKIKDTGAHIEFSDLPHVCCLPIHLVQIFQNLISNAIKFQKKDVPHICIFALEEKNNMHTLCVQDNGIGIKKEHQEKIFTILSRLHHREDFEGTGIGLALTKKIVEHYGGSIWLESDLGKGTTFYFTLPCAR